MKIQSLLNWWVGRVVEDTEVTGLLFPNPKFTGMMKNSCLRSRKHVRSLTISDILPSMISVCIQFKKFHHRSSFEKNR